MTDPDTAGTDPLVTIVAEAIATHSLERCHRGMFSICSCGERFPLTDRPAFNAHQAEAVVAAVRAHQNTTGQQAAVRALRNAADAADDRANDPLMPQNSAWDWRGIARWLRNRADTLELS